MPISVIGGTARPVMNTSKIMAKTTCERPTTDTRAGAPAA